MFFNLNQTFQKVHRHEDMLQAMGPSNSFILFISFNLYYSIYVYMVGNKQTNKIITKQKTAE